MTKPAPMAQALQELHQGDFGGGGEAAHGQADLAHRQTAPLQDAAQLGSERVVGWLHGSDATAAVGGSQRGWFLPLEVPQFKAAQDNPDFDIYIVDNVRQGDPSKFGLKVLGGQRLARLLEKAKQRSYYEVPVPVAEYDSAPGREALRADLPG